MAAEPLPQTSSAAPVRRGGDAWAPSTTPAAGARRADRQGRVVQSMAHKVTRPCSRNGCPAPARASMELDYAGKQVTLMSLLDARDPRFLEVCPTHAERMDVPRGWDLVDERDEEPAVPTGPPTAREMGSSATVAVLAAALREVRDDDPEPDADESPGVVTGAAPGDDPDAPSVVVAESVVHAVAPVAHVAPRDPFPVDPVDPVAVPTRPDPAEPQPPSGRTAEPRHDAARDERQLRLGPDVGPRGEESDRRAPLRVPRPVRAARDEARDQPRST